ncbi:T9SS type A sorting domain-containing protein [Lacinutrix iliipiscaria]|uniref:T9SS type A sorting domain-containing protein n=1 Tax=Lacinutrix iliipiscaria TaxID=1230532 RepID=A0ABW5WNW0_9FLAO
MKKLFNTLSLIMLIPIFTDFTYSQEFNWVNIIGGNGVDSGTTISIDSNGDTYSIGSFSGIIDIDPGPETMDVGSSTGSVEVNSQYLQKLNSNGELIWVDTFDLNEKRMHSLELDDDENIIVTGSFRGEADFDPSPDEFILESGSYLDFYQWNIFVQKLDPSGNLIWAKALIGFHTIDLEVGNGFHYSRFTIDNYDNIYISGSMPITSIIDFDPGVNVFELSGEGNFLLKLNSNGDFIWARKMEPRVTSFSFDSDNNMVLVGSFFYSIDFDPGPEEEIRTAIDITTDIFILKLNEFGDFIWVNTYSGISIDRANSVAIDNSNNIIVTGIFRQTIDFDTSSEVFELSTIETNDGPDVFILKLTESGDLIFAKQIGGVYNQIDRGLVLDNMNNIYVTGNFSGTADFDPNSDVYNLTSSGFDDIFTMKLDSDGIFGWAVSIQSESDLSSEAIAINHSMEEIYLTGFIRGITDFDPTEEEAIYSSNNGLPDIFVLKLGLESLDIVEFDSETTRIFPNPIKNNFIINAKFNGDLELYDSLGKFVKTTKIHPSNNIINVEHLQSGIYFAKIKTEKGIEVLKLIKE